jgi:cobalt-zinc-cadmium efflux system outer membrane protein
VRIAYFQVLLAQRQIDLATTLVRISTQGAESVDSLFQAREVGRGDVLQAQIELENAHILAENARNRHGSAWQTLTAVVANPALPPQPLAGDAFTPPRQIEFQQTLQQIQASSPEIAVATAEIEQARARLDRARVEPIPNVTVTGLVNVMDNAIDGDPNGGITISVQTPIYNRNQGAIFQAQHEVAAARRALQQLELNLQNRLALTFERYANARNQVDRYQSIILPAVSESLELSRKMYEGGETSYINLLVVQRTYFQTHLNYLGAIEALRIAETEIDGLLLSDSLQRR